jgi:hypothetical protein
MNIDLHNHVIPKTLAVAIISHPACRMVRDTPPRQPVGGGEQ